MSKKAYFVEGMHCPSCEIYIESQFKNKDGIKKVKSNSKTQELVVEMNDKTDTDRLIKDINKNIKDAGYTIKEELIKEETSKGNLLLPLLIASSIIIIFFLLEKFVIRRTVFSDNTSYFSIFFIGIIASISSCMAVVGSLVLSMSSVFAKDRKGTLPMTLFHTSRVISFFILGGLLGAMGSLIVISKTTEIIIGIILFLIMLVLAINLLDISPWFRQFELTLPKKLSTSILDKIGGKTILTPILLGTTTFLLPCGFTQAMQLNAVVSGSFVEGALTMLVFSLGTLPILLLITIGSKKIIEGKNSKLFLKTSGFLVLFFAIYNIIGVLVANGVISPIF